MKRAVVFKEVEFDAGHRVPNHKSKCRNLHGHRYRIRVGVLGDIQETEGQTDQGMVIDFGDLKTAMMRVHDKYDHKTVLYEGDEKLKWITNAEQFGIIKVPWIPTAENFAVSIFQDMVNANIGYVTEVQVYETPTSVAVYTGTQT